MSYVFDGVDDYIVYQTPSPTGTHATSELTVLIWVKSDGEQTGSAFYMKQDGYGMLINNGGSDELRGFWMDNDGNDVRSLQSNASFDDVINGVWTPIIFTVTGNDVSTLEVNGSNVDIGGPQTWFSGVPRTDTALWIGAWGLSTYFKGKLAHLAIWAGNKLNATQRAHLVAGRSPMGAEVGLSPTFYDLLDGNGDIINTQVPDTINGATLDNGDVPTVDAPPSGGGTDNNNILITWLR